VTEAMTNLEPFLWSETLAKSRKEKVERQIFHEAAEFHLKEGLCIPIYGPRRYLAFATLAGDQLDKSPSSRAALHVMSLYTHNRLIKLMRAAARPSVDLTRREVDCLQWVAQGKSDWEIGEILKISESTAHWYVESAKRKLGVATRIQAVMSAVSAGLIAY
jgi:DNA-binding CsgD family transcriptional regulator